MSLFVGETGKTFRANAGFDMSSNTALALIFTDPSGTSTTKTSASDSVTLGTTSITDDDLGALTANEWVYWETDTLFSTAGQWKVQVKYTNTASTPDDVFYGNIATFTVLERADSQHWVRLRTGDIRNDQGETP